MAGAVAALHAVGIDDTVGGDPYGVADLHRRLVLLGDRAYGPRGTDLRTLRTFGAAVSPFVGHLGHHQRHQLARRPQHLVGTHGHAQLASGAVRLHITHGERSGRGNGRRTPGDFLLLDHGQAAVDLLLLRPDRRTGHDPDQRKELAARSIGRFPRRNGRLHGRRFHGSGFAAGSGFARKGDRSLAAFPQTVHAGHAAAVIDPVRLRVDARRLAVAGTKAATVTFRGVDTRFENREARHESQDRADRTDRIAIGSAVAPCQHGQHDERHGRHGQRRGALDPDIDRVERIAAGSLGQIGQQVVAPQVKGRKKVGHDTPVGTVRRQQVRHGLEMGGQRHEEQHQYAVAQPRQRPRVAEAVLPPPGGRPRHDILKDAQRADDRTVDPSEKQGQQHECRDHARIDGQDGRQQLHLRHPAEPRMERPREIEQQQRDHREENGRSRDSDFA